MTGKTATRPSFPVVIPRAGSWIAPGLPGAEARSIAPRIDLFGKIPSNPYHAPSRSTHATMCAYATKPHGGGWHADIKGSNIRIDAGTAIMLSDWDELDSPHTWWGHHDYACLYVGHRNEGWTEIEQYSSEALSSHFHEPVTAWLEVTHGTTWHGAIESIAHDYTSTWAVDHVAAVITASLGEHFESGYQSTFRKNLIALHRWLGFPVVEALCAELKALSRPYSGLLQESFAFLTAVGDEQSLDFRLVFLASYLRDPSPVIRDAAAVALADLGDKRGIEYLKAAAANEAHPRLKYEYLEIAAELGV